MSERHLGRVTVKTSNEDKLFFDTAGLTKGDLIDYYERIAPCMLPHLRDRPLVFQRFPDGVDAQGFYQKQVQAHFPEFIATVEVDVHSRGGTQELVVCNGKAALVYLADQACITLHPWLSRQDAIDKPDQMIVDLDPAGDDFSAVRVAALRVRDLFEQLKLPSFAKLTGSKGIHVVVPLRREEDFDSVRNFARSAMDLLARRYPEELTTEQRKDKRRGRLYLDVGRNAYGQTAVAPWSVRPLSEAPVAAPVSWAQIEGGAVGPRDYTVRNVFRRIGGRDDPWRSLRRRAHSLAEPRQRLHRLLEGQQASAAE